MQKLFENWREFQKEVLREQAQARFEGPYKFQFNDNSYRLGYIISGRAFYFSSGRGTPGQVKSGDLVEFGGTCVKFGTRGGRARRFGKILSQIDAEFLIGDFLVEGDEISVGSWVIKNPAGKIINPLQLSPEQLISLRKRAESRISPPRVIAGMTNINKFLDSRGAFRADWLEKMNFQSCYHGLEDKYPQGGPSTVKLKPGHVIDIETESFLRIRGNLRKQGLSESEINKRTSWRLEQIEKEVSKNLPSSENAVEGLANIKDEGELAQYIIDNNEEIVRYVIEQVLPGGLLTGAFQILDNENWRKDTSKVIYDILKRDAKILLEVVKKLLAGDIAGAKALIMEIIVKEVGGWLKKKWDEIRAPSKKLWDQFSDTTPEDWSRRAAELAAPSTKMNENKLIVTIGKKII